ncbi:5,10-methylenetetrahydromethanopterin reductase [Microbacterium sp. SORGH_AS428]|uniref:LLM class flavin-dependent oxidoreductase n=1 Tax=Microbacterium sp. SORGH_AS_0428 TaxID=3041788 RepID=UPI0028650310|nr:LLM class flavin-dependent oxidoreductase [Microbacterium sp. SORGH_AS_0428]MDR6201276.1 5,10-methylenetetrahydromethanopterin reductase [Microbacterium sp. SORGH_AS_0428]
MPSATKNVGIMLPRDLPVAEVLDFARKAEESGFDEIWVVEDLGYRGGIAQAASVLAVTSRVTVGVGILPAAVRNVAFAAMEIATLAQLHPGRIVVGIGHGMPGWLSSVGAWPQKPLTFLREYVVALRALLEGAQGPERGTYVDVEGLRLSETPDIVPPIVLGVRGPKSLAAVGEVADGVVLAEPAAPEYIAHALERIGEVETRVITYDLAVVADTTDAAQAIVRPALAVLAESDWRPHVLPLPYAEELLQLASDLPVDAFTRTLPTEWVTELTLSGTVEEVRAGIQRRHDAGATTVVFIPVGANPSTTIRDLAEAIPGRR